MSSNPAPLAVAHTAHGSYDKVSQSLHWLTFVMIIIMFVTGWARSFFAPEWRTGVMILHTSSGVGILGLTLLRLLWRPVRLCPAPLAKGLLHLVAQLAHLALYGLLVAMPLCGWLMVSAFGHPVSVGGLFDLPPLLEKNRELAIWLKEIHEWMAYLFFALIGGHAAAALLHHFLLKDATLLRMLPVLAARSSKTTLS